MVVGVFGPTASGKTDVAEALADRLDGELVSADAMQAYRGLPVLTNQSDRPTRLVGVWPLDHDASIAEYQELAQAAVDEIVAEGRTPVVVGGTGLYLRAALAGLELPPPAPATTRSRLERLYDSLGSERAHAALTERDPVAAARVHANDRRRVVRALELVELGSSLAPSSDTLWGGGYRHPTVVIGLEVSRDELGARIEARTRSMVEHGVVDEARRALAGAVSQTALTVHGLRDFAELPLEEAVETYNRRVRRYAAYQRKWMRHIPGVVIIDANRLTTEVADEIVTLARARERVPGDGAVRADG